jgi:hypothetical protein
LDTHDGEPLMILHRWTVFFNIPPKISIWHPLEVREDDQFKAMRHNELDIVTGEIRAPKAPKYGFSANP